MYTSKEVIIARRITKERVNRIIGISLRSIRCQLIRLDGLQLLLHLLLFLFLVCENFPKVSAPPKSQCPKYLSYIKSQSSLRVKTYTYIYVCIYLSSRARQAC